MSCNKFWNICRAPYSTCPTAVAENEAESDVQQHQWCLQGSLPSWTDPLYLWDDEIALKRSSKICLVALASTSAMTLWCPSWTLKGWAQIITFYVDNFYACFQLFWDLLVWQIGALLPKQPVFSKSQASDFTRDNPTALLLEWKFLILNSVEYCHLCIMC